MNLKEALKILHLSHNFTTKQLKKAYFKQALLYHPDKNKDETAKETFQKVQNAYDYLLKMSDENETCNNYSFNSILLKCVQFLQSNEKWDNIFIETTIKTILNDCKNVSVKMFESVSKDKAIQIYDFLCKYRDFFAITPDMLETMKDIIQKKMKLDNIILLNPSLDDLLKQNIYKLELSNETYYIPLWHNELYYDIGLIVKINPELPKNIKLDYDNNIHICKTYNIKQVFEDGHIYIKELDIKLDSHLLSIKKKQIIPYNKIGIPLINQEDIFDVRKKGQVFVHITLI